MQTFLPYRSFETTSQVLDRSRLGKQRVEAWQIIDVSLRIQRNENPRWANHPARLMWENHLYCLCSYGITICEEWIRRGYKDIMLARFIALQENFEDTGEPEWLGDEDFHIRHRSNLIRKGMERWRDKQKDDILKHYRSLWPDVPDNLPYIWPRTSKNEIILV